MADKKHDQSSTRSGKDALGEVDAKLVAELEQILLDQRDEIVRANPKMKRHDRPVRKVEYRGQRLEVRVPRVKTPEGKYQPVPMYEELKPQRADVAAYRTAGVSTRGVAALLEATLPGGAPPGSSKSNVHRLTADEARRRYDEINTRSLKPEHIVAIQLDGKTLEKGTKKKKKTILVAQGVTIDGRKRVLGIAEGESENHELVLRLLRNLTDRGIDYPVLWVLDGGSALWKGVRMHADPGEALIQNCLVHFVRKLREHLPTEERHELLRERMYKEAWNKNDPDLALARLRGMANELEAEGLAAAANSLRNGLEETATVMRMGFDWTTRQALRTTNSIESAMKTIGVQARNVARWTEGDMRLQWTAWALFEAEKRWGRIADPPDLVALQRRLAPGRYRPEALLTRLPPTFATDRLVVPTAEASEAERLATEMLASPERPVWLGATAVLGRFGLRPGTEVSEERLALALQGRHASTGDQLRKVSSFDVQTAREAEPAPDPVTGVDALRWTLTASEPVAVLWNEGDAGQRAEIEAALLEGAHAAFKRVTHNDKETWDVAAVASVKAIAPAEPDGAPRLVVEGVAFGAVRGTGQVRSPVIKEALERAEARRAADAAMEGLGPKLQELARERERASPDLQADERSSDGSERDPAGPAPDAGSERPADHPADHELDPSSDPVPRPPVPESAAGRAPPPRPDPRAADSLDLHRDLLGTGRAANLEARVRSVEPGLRESDGEWLVARRTFLGDPFARFDRSAARVTLTLERDRIIARNRLSDARQGGHTKAVESLQGSLDRMRDAERDLRDAGTHPAAWLRHWGDDAAEGIAIERVLASRGLALDWSARDERAAAARRARVELLGERRPLIDAGIARHVATSAEWPAAWLQDAEDEMIASRVGELGRPLDDLEQIARGDRELPSEADRRELVGRAGRWVALKGEIDVRERARDIERPVPAEPPAPAAVVEQVTPDPAAVDVDAGVGAEL